MQTNFLTGRDVEITLRRFIGEYDEFHWAVAWGAMTDVARDLFRHPGKFKNVTFGVAFSQTDPNLIDALQGINGAMVATKFPGGTYHPKVYLFRSGTRAAAVIGSANFTFGGLGKNREAAVAFIGNANDPLFKDLFNFTKGSAKFGERVSAQFAIAYRASFRCASRMAKPPRDPVKALGLIKPAGFASTLIPMTWDEFVKEVNGSVHHDIQESLSLLRIAQKWFASVRYFADLLPAQRKAIAGTIGEKAKTTADLHHNWGWFGSMSAMGDFANRIEENDRHLSQALDCIPRKGEVTNQHYMKFVAQFRRAFRNSTRKGGVPTASRLLAMKRPDTFVCICGPNITEASRRMGFSQTTLTLNNYWDRVVEIVRLSDWYQAEKPSGINSELWENRVAMLDAILYRA